MRSNQVQRSTRGTDLDKLNPQQLMFIKHLLADPSYNYTDAARKAGYKQPGLAVNRLLKDGRVSRAIGKEIHKRAETCEIAAADVLLKLKDVINLDPVDFFDSVVNEHGERLFVIKKLDEIPAHIRKCITKIKSRTFHKPDGNSETYFEIEFMSKDSALSLLMDHLGMKGKTRIEVGATGNLENLLGTLLNQVESNNNVVDAISVSEALTSDSEVVSKVLEENNDES